MLSAWVLTVAAATAMPSDPMCGLSALPGLSRQFSLVILAEPGPAAAGTAEEFARVAAGILGEEPSPGVDWATHAGLPCGDSVRRRDRLAWQMALVGHSAKEIADVLNGHITIADLNQAQARLMSGQPRARVAEFIEARWRGPAIDPGAPAVVPSFTAAPAAAAVAPKALAIERGRTDMARSAPARARAAPAARSAPAVEPEAAAVVVASRPRAETPWLEVNLERELEALEREHAVPAGLVRAMVAAESGGNPRAVSPAGAIGLMQLMPATAAALGVDPWQPRENLRGGVTYIADLMRAYDGDIRLALIAYNAGPQHANRVRAGNTVAYRETRRYLDAIALHYPLP